MLFTGDPWSCRPRQQRPARWRVGEGPHMSGAGSITDTLSCLYSDVQDSLGIKRTAAIGHPCRHGFVHQRQLCWFSADIQVCSSGRAQCEEIGSSRRHRMRQCALGREP
jgi:hypothetical protein